ncbi:hypothetical protein NC653_019028 [Populus alba x Populus x berolinensis]|uniref:Uncharacterized protein n=1 Tax=Populus alba x Populus x berolinensis TaxID=444605 RepID=A0AAD6QHS6_9ROSI|nr:hypothetical protein NC653_019028 [Populus alba x Populus x berolinensis]
MAEERGLQQAGGVIVIDVNATLALHKKDHESERKAIYTGSEFWESASGVGGGIVLESISFYAEQDMVLENDTRTAYHDCIVVVIEGPFGLFQVCDVQNFGGFILHIDSLIAESGRFSTGDKVICKEVLDNHVDRKGSTILLEKLRFDFSHVDPELLRKIESIVNGQIKDELDVFAKETALTEAKQINSLRAVFGEVSLAALFALY